MTDTPPRVRAGDWMQTFSGRRFWPAEPEPRDVAIEDIAHALSNACRYGGHCLRFYSVAQHSVLVSNLVPDELSLHGLLHDAAEAYLGDMISPLRRTLRDSSPMYEALHSRVDMAISRRFGLRPLTPAQAAALKHADLVALATERRDLMRPTGDEWPVLDGIVADDEEIVAWSPGGSEAVFLDTFEGLTRGGVR